MQRESADSVQLAADADALRAAEAECAHADARREEAEHAAAQLLQENRRLQQALLAEREAAEQAQVRPQCPIPHSKSPVPGYHPIP